jgi:hypothetical protein
MARDHGLEVECLQLLEIGRPLVVKAEVERAGAPDLRRSRRWRRSFSFGRYTIRSVSLCPRPRYRIRISRSPRNRVR